MPHRRRARSQVPHFLKASAYQGRKTKCRQSDAKWLLQRRTIFANLALVVMAYVIYRLDLDRLFRHITKHSIS